ncbi:hypothetical protein ZIOFF_029553 [Zingiber officinale]|uniref:F-box/LRR-repeat protein 15-like leucin rich repeat domain-containing protein n=1 Tax=Zingiber officinale TaxID=94328 RepID=A0A8J5H892_ZINOF|nr:hypothetical protein ZIOFF_029553 [Zingiber officinale]
MAAVAEHCPGLRKLSVGSCTFSYAGVDAVVQRCPMLVELSIKRLRGLPDSSSMVESIIGATSLFTMDNKVPGIVEIHLEKLHVSDRGLAALSLCDREILHLVKTPKCTDDGLAAVAKRCPLLRKIHIDGWKTNRIGDEGLIVVARKYPNLQELALIGVNPTARSMGLIASDCPKLERLAPCSSETFGDPEIICIASKCMALRKLCIKGCPVSDQGIVSLAEGCPKLVKVKVKKCHGVTSRCADWLMQCRDGMLAVNLDVTGSAEHQESIGENGVLENNEHLIGHVGAGCLLPSRSYSRSLPWKSPDQICGARDSMKRSEE